MKTDRLFVERRALAEMWRRRNLLAVQLVGNVLLAGLAYGWLWIPERSVWEVVFSAVLGLAVVLGFVWLHGTALAAFHLPGGPLPVRAVMGRLPRLLPWAALVTLVIAVGVRLGAHEPGVSAYLASLLTLRVRTPVSPQQVEWVYPALLRSAALILVLILLPLASQAAGGGFAWRDALRLAVRPRYWAACAALLAAGLYLPGKLIWWVPAFQSLPLQAISMILRFAAAYLLAVTAWVTLAALIGSSLRRA